MIESVQFAIRLIFAFVAFWGQLVYHIVELSPEERPMYAFLVLALAVAFMVEIVVAGAAVRTIRDKFF